jgi:CDP-paratose 2-epimerase
MTRRPFALITGGAGFIGSNLAARLLEQGRAVRLLDDLSRPGVERNVEWLRRRFGEAVSFERADVRDQGALRRALEGVEAVFHFAAQVAVTTSLEAPSHDAAVNLLGTLGLLEELRAQKSPPPLLYTSTNKVYGALEDVSLVAQGRRWEPLDPTLRARGVSEARPLAIHSPYGCSKGAADQYVLDWARSYGLRNVVFRMSCIYGPRQLGTEDQGWVAHFVARAIAQTDARARRAESPPITLYGDGHQVRDALFVDDLVEALLAAHERLDATAGQAFNVGGGPANTTSLLQLLDEIADLEGRAPDVRVEETWRTGDQRWYVSDVAKLGRATGWRPRVGLREGLARLHAWLREEAGLRRAHEPTKARATTPPPARRAAG